MSTARAHRNRRRSPQGRPAAPGKSALATPTKGTAAPAAPPPPALPTTPGTNPVPADVVDPAADVLALAEDTSATLIQRADQSADRQTATAGPWATEAEQLRADAATGAEAVTERADRVAERTVTDARPDTKQDANGITRAANERTTRITADAQAAANTLTGDADQNATAVLNRAQQQAGALLRAAEDQAEKVRRKAAEHASRTGTDARQLLADAESTAAALTQAAGEQAEQIRDQAQRDAHELREQAVRIAAKVRQDAAEQAEAALGEARTQVAALLGEGRSQAEELRRTGQVDADRVRSEVCRLREEADREVDQATAAAREIRSNAGAEAERIRGEAGQEARRQRTEAAKDAAAVREEAKQEARRIRREADQLAMLDKAETGRAVDEARLREEQAGQAQQAADQALDQARKVLERATGRTVKRLEKRRLKQEARVAERAGRLTLSCRVKAFVKANSKRLLAIVPITAPMAVAWTGQAGFAHDILNWVAPFTILFAAAWELSTAFVAWMYHEARQGGDSGTLYRVATWVFAVGAAVMNYWHASATVTGQKWDPATLRMVDQISYWDPTPKAVAFSVMSITGMVLWELYARLIHRQKLRADGKVAKSRPTIGLIRWARYPGHSFAAWSLAITDESLSTVELAWTAAANHRALVRRTGLGPVRRIAAAIIGVGDWVPVRALPRVPNSSLVLTFAGSVNPAAVPQFAVRIPRSGSPNRFANQHSTSANPAFPPVRTGSPGGWLELEAASPANHIGRSGKPVAADPEPRTGPQQGQCTTRTPGEPAPSASSNRRSAAQVLADEQVRQVLALIDELGYDAVLLDVVIDKTGMKRTTAHHRLAEARKEFTNRSVAPKQFANQGSA
ncbi:hypothetical protein [Kitasatospora indigofera]|uniref:hypothetical protein n=1 Tax=Kitasatospora indigofera TaxID=67307 RepID=UPI00368D5136